MDTKCKICGNEDLYSFATGGGVCAVCTMKFLGGGSASPQSVAAVRSRLGLKDGEYLKQDVGLEASKILGRA